MVFCIAFSFVKLLLVIAHAGLQYFHSVRNHLRSHCLYFPALVFHMIYMTFSIVRRRWNVYYPLDGLFLYGTFQFLGAISLSVQ